MRLTREIGQATAVLTDAGVALSEIREDVRKSSETVALAALIISGVAVLALVLASVALIRTGAK